MHHRSVAISRCFTNSCRCTQAMGIIRAKESWTTYDADDVVAGLQVIAQGLH